MNGGKDIKFGDDKRQVSIVPANRVDLYNIANGEILTDEFGTPLIAEVDEFYIPDASKKRSSSIVFNDTNSPYIKKSYSNVGIITVTYGDFDVYLSQPFIVLQASSATVGVGSTVQTISDVITLDQYPYQEVKVVTNQGSEKNKVYCTTPVGISSIIVGDYISGANIPDNTYVSKVAYNTTRLTLSNDTTNTSTQTKSILIQRYNESLAKSDVVWKIAEKFKESSEVSTSLLGVNRAEVQLSLFSNVSSYGLDPNEFEYYSYNTGYNFYSWENRRNAIYGNRYLAKSTEEVQESAIQLTTFPVPYSYPFGPNFERLGLYNADLFQKYLNFIQLGNDLYDYFTNGAGSSYPDSWKSKFLSSAVYVNNGDAVYSLGIDNSFALIDTWTDTWRDIKDGILNDPVTGTIFNFASVSQILSSSYDSTNTRPGYSDTEQRYGYLQSRRVFRYQPGRISGFTFGLRSSTEPVSGSVNEWGISNPTDQYVFQIKAGQFSIIRRSTIPLELSVLTRNGLTLADQTRIASGDPFDSTQYWTINIPRDKFNGDSLDSNGPSGYLLNPEKVTMYKIEFGWYGAIGARFYAYIPVGNGEARWVVIHTLVIENQLEKPCLQDSYFRFKYSVNVSSTGDIRKPIYLYKYGASYYIDGGDEGTSQIYSVSSKQKTINSSNSKSLLGIRPKQVILNRDGVGVQNKKLIIPTELNISTDSLTEVKVVDCKACPGFGHVYTPGVATTESGQYVDIEFTDANTIAAVNDSYFYENNIGAKIIAPSIYNAYISNVTDSVGTAGSYLSATIKGFGGLASLTLTNRDIGGSLVYDRVAGITTTVGIGVSYPHPVRLSNYNSYAAADFAFTGSKIEVQFLNPNAGDDYAHFADFLIGITNKKPDVSLPDTLNGFIIVGSGTTTTLPNSDILYGEHTHSYAYVDEDGVERAEGWAPVQPPLRMGIDYRIPNPAGAASGVCSKVTINVQDSLSIKNVNEYNVNPKTGLSDGNTYVQVAGQFPTVDYNGGQVAIVGSGGAVSIPGPTFVGITSSYVGAGSSTFSFIQISSTLGAVGSNFTIAIRPVNITAPYHSNNPGTNINSTKIYNYNPFPLYLVAKLKDNAQINNISVKETIGDFTRTISPIWYKSSNTTVTNANGNADTTGIPPTNFEEITRLSSALVDTQNQQQLRPYTERDTLYVGANTTETISMSKVFGQDRNVITPDNNNLEATFLIAKKIDSGGTGTIETSLNFKEQ